MEETKPRFLSFAEATAWAMEHVTQENSLEEHEKLHDTFKEITKDVKYQRWLIEVGELKEQLETQLDNAQDIWMEGEEFKSWLVKKDGHWYDVERAMQQVYSHIDSALHFLKIIRGEKKDD
jgi:hypothetical protein